MGFPLGMVLGLGLEISNNAFSHTRESEGERERETRRMGWTGRTKPRKLRPMLFSYLGFSTDIQRGINTINTIFRVGDGVRVGIVK